MAQILALSKAVALDQLLAQTNTHGIEWQILPYDGELPKIVGIGSLSDATSNEIGFLANPKFFDLLQHTKAAAVILPKRAVEAFTQKAPFVIIQCENPYLLYARLSQWFDQARIAEDIPQIHPSAIIDPSVQIGKNVNIHPRVVIEKNVVLGDNVSIGAGTVIGQGSVIASHTRLHANVTLYHGIKIGEHCIIHSGAVIGADGFGFAPDASIEQGAWSKIAQLGCVILEDHVEVGANTTIDRGALGDTIIRRGVKLDNQIMIAHNCDIGEHTAMAACVGVAGSTHIGKRCTLAGAAMVAGHLRIGDDVHISGGTGVMSSIEEAGRYTGLWPIMEHKTWQRNAGALNGLYDLRRRVQALEKN